MKLICPSCKNPNLPTTSSCHSCLSKLEMNFKSEFQNEDGEVFSMLDLFSKMQTLEKRLTYVEQHYSPKKTEILEEDKTLKKEPIVELKPIEKKAAFSVPKELPRSKEALELLYDQVEKEKKKAKEMADISLHAELDFESKKIARRLTSLKEEGEPKTEQQENFQEKKPVEKTVRPQVEEKSYPKDIEGLKALLEETIALRKKASAVGNLQEVLMHEAEEKTLNRLISNLELAELYGKSEEEKEEVVEENKEVIRSNINKRLIFEIEQELSLVWKAKQKASLSQNIVRLNAILEKEARLKEELKLANSGAIQERLKEEEQAVLKEAVKEVPATLSSAKATTQAAVATKKVALPPQGPSAIEEFFAPIGHAFTFVEKRYNQYKTEGKLPLFFLTLAGIVTLLFGFGFLAQYSAVTYFGEYLTQIKVGFGFVCSGISIGIGIKLIHKDKKYAEFGAALMGLGLVMNYLFIYFLSAAPPIISPTKGFILIFINTAISVGMSLRYQSKIIAILALVGGALSPSYLQSTGENTHIFFAYLWILCAASAFVAHRLKWELLNFVAFVLVSLMLGTSAYSNYMDVRTLSDNTYLLLFHAFAYLFAYVSLFDGLKPKSKQSSMTIITLVGAQAAMMMSLFAVYGLQQESYFNLGTAYLLNMLPFVGITALFWNTWTERQKSLLIGISSAFVAAAIPAYFGMAYRGLLWSLQGIVLLGAGLVFKLLIVRRIAYSIIVGGMANMLANLDLNSMPNRATGILFTEGYINLWSIGIVLATISALLKKYEENLLSHEKKVPVVFNEVISVWGLFVFYVTTYFFFHNYAYNLAILPMVVLLLWNNYRKLYVAELLGLGQMAVLIYCMLISMDSCGSPHFADQLLYGKLAMLEVLLVLWALPLFYEKVLPNAPVVKHALAQKARTVFYVILPLAILDTFNHGLPGYILYGLWGMTLLTFALAEFTKSKVVLVEFLAFALIASGACFIEIEYAPILLGNAIFIGINGYKKSWIEENFNQPDYQLVYLLSPYFMVASLGLIYFDLSQDDLFSAMLIVGAALLSLVNLGHKLPAVERTTPFAYRGAWGISLLALGLLFAQLSSPQPISSAVYIGYTALAVVLLWSHKMIYIADIPYRGDQSSALWKLESVVLHGLNFVTYFVLLFTITNDAASLWLTIAMFIHGIALVFNGLQAKYKHLTKVYIALFVIALAKLFLLDMKDADTIMKIIVFIVVGIICLVAAFMLIKYKDNNKEKIAVEIEDKEAVDSIEGE